MFHHTCVCDISEHACLKVILTQLVFHSRYSTDWTALSSSFYEWRYLLNESVHGNKNYLMKSGNKLKFLVKLDERTKSVNLLYRTRFRFKLSVSQLPNVPVHLKGLLTFIDLFTWPESYTDALSQYTEFLKFYILYCPIKMACILVNKSKSFMLLQEKIYDLAHIASFFLFFHILLPYLISPFILRWKKIVTIFIINYMNYTYVISCKIVN